MRRPDLRRDHDLHRSYHLRWGGSLSPAHNAWIPELRGHRIMRRHNLVRGDHDLQWHNYVLGEFDVLGTGDLPRDVDVRRYCQLPGLDHLLRPTDLWYSTDLYSLSDLQSATNLRQQADLLQCCDMSRPGHLRRVDANL